MLRPSHIAITTALLLAAGSASAATDDAPPLRLRSALTTPAASMPAAAMPAAAIPAASMPAAATDGILLAQADDDIPESSSALPDSEVQVGGAQLGESVGGATGFVFRQGLYTQSDLGGFFVLGAGAGSPTGFSIGQDCGGPPCRPVPTSQLQPFIGLSVGYDLTQWLGIQASFGTGFVANAAVYPDSLDNPRDYGLTFVNLAVVGSFYVLERLAIMGKIFGGAAFMSPEPAPNEPTIGGNVGVGIGVRYATLLPDVFVGIDGNVMVAALPSSGPELVIVPAISFAPVIKYVF